MEAAYLRFSKFNHQYLKIKKRSSKCTQQPPFFFLSLFVIRTLNGYYKSVCLFFKSFFFPWKRFRAQGALLSSLAQFLLWKEGNFFVWQSTHNKRRRRKKKEKSSQTNCRLGERTSPHSPVNFGPLETGETNFPHHHTTLGTRATAGGKRKTIYMYRHHHHHQQPVFSSSSWAFAFFFSVAAAAKKYKILFINVYLKILSPFFRGFFFHLSLWSFPSSYNVFQLLLGDP